MELKTKTKALMHFKCFALFLLLFPKFVLADICFRSFEKDTTRSQAIFVGKAIDIVKDKYWLGGNPHTITTFEVYESFKGLSKYDKYISLITTYGGGCCPYYFFKDSTYLVFAYWYNDGTTLFTKDCTYTNYLSKSKHYYSLLPDPIIHDHPNEYYYSLIKADANKLDSLRQNKTFLENEVTLLSSKSTKRGYVIVGLGILTVLLGAAFLLMYRRLLRLRGNKGH